MTKRGVLRRKLLRFDARLTKNNQWTLYSDPMIADFLCQIHKLAGRQINVANFAVYRKYVSRIYKPFMGIVKLGCVRIGVCRYHKHKDKYPGRYTDCSVQRQGT